MTEHTFILAKITPKTECFDLAKAAIMNIIPTTLIEPGCLKFALHQDTKGNLFLYEEWLDDKALQNHHEMKYTQAVFEAYNDWLACPPEITTLTKLG
ncbi:putative quinol monooxygenase [Shewanella sp. SR44-3]|uniref:putative quinol monooxygenase n=1 Tax=unclassified Shewanella TaxID=196818 RepID=UPI0015FB0B7D|nr:putative quinol monooxygenase [Shewanella sp. SR44-3]MBB1269146.1 antibiotic biosynthesis monooxygenase [Shewanella sp. SR44-3]